MKTKFYPSSTDRRCLEFSEISGNINHEFTFHGEVRLIRITAKKKGWHDKFERIKIGDKEFTNADSIGYMTPSTAWSETVQDFIFTAEFKKGDTFFVEHNDCIDTITLFM